MITYTHTISDLRPDQLTGFFVDWPNPPTAERHLSILKAASHVVLPIDDRTGRAFLLPFPAIFRI
jgi:hypothetical protein